MITKILRIIKHAAVYLFVNIPLELLSAVIVPIVLLFVPSNNNTLPKVFRWFDNGDNDGLDGGEFYLNRYGYTRLYPTHTPRHKVTNKPIGYWKHLYIRYLWLSWRNPCNYYYIHILGYSASNSSRTLEWTLKGDYPIGDMDNPGYSYIARHDTIKDKIVWELYYIKPYKIPLISTQLCVRLRLGYKITKNQRVGARMAWVFVINPFQIYRGK